jgi:hypothetical protein
MSRRNKTGTNFIILAIAICLVVGGAYMVSQEPVYVDYDNDTIPDQYDEDPTDPEIYDEVPPNELDPDDPYYDPEYDEAPYEPNYPRVNPKEIGVGSIFGGDGQFSLGDMLIFVGIGLFLVGFFSGRR